MEHPADHTFRCISVSAVAMALAVMGCGRSPSTGDGVDQFPRVQTLYVGGFQWGPPTSFNPLHMQPAWPITGNINLVYEALFGYNQLTAGLEGILGERYELGANTLTVTLRPETRWHDDRPVTSDDVVFTFHIHRTYNTAYHAYWNYLDDVTADGPRRVVFTLSRANPNRLIALDIISSTPILPRHVFEPLVKAAEKLPPSERLNAIAAAPLDSLPVASGPYTVYTHTPEKIVLRRVDSYWGNGALYGGRLPAPTYIIHVTYSGNDKFNLALQQGQLDISQTFCPQVWNKFRYGVGTWYPEQPYYIPGIIPALLMNHTKAPFSDRVFRRAAAMAINYDQIRRLAMYGYSPELKPGLILPFGNEARYYHEEDAEAHAVRYDPAAARALLASAGYTWGPDSMLAMPDGRRVGPLTMSCPSGWSDWEATIRIAVAGMRAVGIDVRERFVEWPVWDKDLKNGLFDFTMKTPFPQLSPSAPWSRFVAVMSSRQWSPPGSVMYENEGRYRNPDADRLLALIPTITDSLELTRAYRDLNALFMRELPVIPLMYRPWLFYQFSTAYWSDFPTDAAPTAPPQCLMVGAGVKALWEIRPK